MKRKWLQANLEEVTSEANFKNHLLKSPLKPYSIKLPHLHKHNQRVPSSLIPTTKSIRIKTWVSDLLKDIIKDEDDMIEDSPRGNLLTNIKFIFFLGAQGKEFIQHIREKFPKYFKSILFISSNISSDIYNKPKFSNNQQSLQLTSYFKVLDPLGGGSYPLDYLFIIDETDLIRCKLPIRVNRCYSPHEKFGADLNKLDSLIEEYLQYFSLDQTNFII